MKKMSGNQLCIVSFIIFFTLIMRIVITWQGWHDIGAIVLLLWIYLWAIHGIVCFIENGYKDD